MGDIFRAMKEAKKERHAHQFVTNTALVKDLGLGHESKNGGQHLILRMQDGELADFWPSSGKWFARRMKRYGIGLHRLVKLYS